VTHRVLGPSPADLRLAGSDATSQEVGQTITMVVPHAAGGPGVARRALARDLRGRVDPSVVENAMLLVSELVGNAVLHGRAMREGGVRVSWSLGSDDLLLRVTDGGGGRLPRVRRTSGTALSGRGLSIVESLSQSWGVEWDVACVTVWAHLPTSLDRERALADALPQ